MNNLEELVLKFSESLSIVGNELQNSISSLRNENGSINTICLIALLGAIESANLSYKRQIMDMMNI